MPRLFKKVYVGSSSQIVFDGTNVGEVVGISVGGKDGVVVGRSVGEEVGQGVSH